MLSFNFNPEEDTRVDYVTVYDPAVGYSVPRPLRGTPVEAGGQTFPSAWHRDAYIRDLRRELEGVEHNLTHLLGPTLPWVEPWTKEQIAKQRTSLENTREAIVAELARLEDA